MSKTKLFALVVACFLLLASTASATPPRTLTYQGYLTTAAGIPVDSSVTMVFSLYGSATGGTPLWSETLASVTVAKGMYSVVMGKTSALNLPFDAPYFLGVAVGSDPEMTPRQEFAAVPYTLRAAIADKLGQVCSDGEILKYNSTSASWSCATAPAGPAGPAGAAGATGPAGAPGATGPAGPGITWQVVTANTNAVAGTGYIVNGFYTITLPSAPNPGDIIRVTGGTSGSPFMVTVATPGTDSILYPFFTGSITGNPIWSLQCAETFTVEFLAILTTPPRFRITNHLPQSFGGNNCSIQSGGSGTGPI